MADEESEAPSEAFFSNVDLFILSLMAGMAVYWFFFKNTKKEQPTFKKLATIEKKYQDQIRGLHGELEKERENFSAFTARHKQSVDADVIKLRKEEGKLREQLSFTQTEVERLSRDLEEATGQLDESERHGQRLQRELNGMENIHRKLSEFENAGILHPEEHSFAQEKIQRLEQDNKDLKDQNDELRVEQEQTKHQTSPARRPLATEVAEDHAHNPIRQDGSVMSDYIKPFIVKKNTSFSSADYSDDDAQTLAVPRQQKQLLKDDDDISLGSTSDEESVEQLKRQFELEKKGVEEHYKLEIAAIEERHDTEKQEILRHLEQEKRTLDEAFQRLQEEALAELAKELQTNFANEKDDLVKKHASEKNYLKQLHSEEKQELLERLQVEADHNLKTNVQEMKSRHKEEREELEQALDDAEARVEDLEKQKVKLEQQKTHLEKQVAQFEEQSDKLEEDSTLSKKQIDQLKETLKTQSEESEKEILKQKAETEGMLSRHLQNVSDVERQKHDLEIKFRKQLSDMKMKHEEEMMELTHLMEEQKHDMEIKFRKQLSEVELTHREEIIELTSKTEEQKHDLEVKFKKQLSELEMKHKEEKTELTSLSEKQKHDFEVKFRKQLNDIEMKHREETLAVTSPMEEQKQELREARKQLALVELELTQQRDEMEVAWQQERREVQAVYEEKIGELQEKITELQEKTRELQEVADGKEADFANVLDRGVDGLRGQVREDFYRLLDSMTAEAVERERKVILDNLNQREKQLETELDTKKSELSHVFEKEKAELVERYEEQAAALRAELDRLQGKLEEEREALAQRYEGEREALEEQLAQQIKDELEEELCDQMEEIKEAYEDAKRGFEAEATLLRGEIDDLQRDLDRETKNRKQLEELRRDNTRLQQEKRQAEKGQQEVRESLIETRATLEARIDELLAEKDGAVSAVKAEFVEVSRQSGRDMAHYEAVVMEKEGLEVRLTQLNKELTELQSKTDSVDRLQVMLEQLTREITDLTSRLQSSKTSHEQPSTAVPEHAQTGKEIEALDTRSNPIQVSEITVTTSALQELDHRKEDQTQSLKAMKEDKLQKTGTDIKDLDQKSNPNQVSDITVQAGNRQQLEHRKQEETQSIKGMKDDKLQNIETKTGKEIEALDQNSYPTQVPAITVQTSTLQKLKHRKQDETNIKEAMQDANLQQTGKEIEALDQSSYPIQVPAITVKTSTLQELEHRKQDETNSKEAMQDANLQKTGKEIEALDQSSYPIQVPAITVKTSTLQEHEHRKQDKTKSKEAMQDLYLRKVKTKTGDEIKALDQRSNPSQVPEITVQTVTLQEAENRKQDDTKSMEVMQDANLQKVETKTGTEIEDLDQKSNPNQVSDITVQAGNRQQLEHRKQEETQSIKGMKDDKLQNIETKTGKEIEDLDQKSNPNQVSDITVQTGTRQQLEHREQDRTQSIDGMKDDKLQKKETKGPTSPVKMPTFGSILVNENRAYYLKFISFLSDGGRIALLNKLQDLIPKRDIIAHVKNNKNKIDKLLREKVISNWQYDLLFPTSGKPDSSKFDITLLTCLLRSTTCLRSNSIVWAPRTPPIASDVSTEADIARLRNTRNKYIGHPQKTELAKLEFEAVFSDTKKVLKRLGTKIPDFKTKLNEYKTKTIDPLRESELLKEVSEWKARYESLEEREQKWENLHTSIDALKQKQDTIHLQQEIIQQHLDKMLDKMLQQFDVWKDLLDVKCKGIPTLKINVCICANDVETDGQVDYIVYKVFNDAINKADDPDDPESLKDAVKGVVYVIEKTGAVVESAEHGSIILNITCLNLQALEQTLSLFRLKQSRWHLHELEKALGDLFQEEFEVELTLPVETVELISNWMDETETMNPELAKHDTEDKSEDVIGEVTTLRDTPVMAEAGAGQHSGQTDIQTDGKRKINMSEMGEVKTEIGEVKSEIGEVKSELSGFQHRLKSHEEKNNSLHNDKDSDKDVVGEIRDYLISLYNKNCQTMPIYPLKPEWRKHVQGLYVIPTMVEINPWGVDLEHTKDRAGLFSSDNRETKVDDIRSIFYKGDTLCRDICLVGEFGSGKSVLCEYLVHLWVKCHSSSSQPDDNFMKNFNFLFYISLRYAESCDVESIIRDQLKIPHAEEISKFLSENTWLLILDGLDEFSQTSKLSRFQSQNIPTRHHSPKSTYLTTSRPWKIELLRKELENKMVRHIAILGMEGKEQKQLATNALDLLNHDKGRNKTVEDFFKDVTNQKLSKQLESPVLLMQMLGIWFHEKPFGRSQCDIYSNTVEMQLQFTEEIKGISVDNTHLTTETETQVQLPACFKDFGFCQKYKSLLLKLSKLANQQLFSKNREATLVFDHGQMEISGMSETEITLCLKLGLLTQFKVIGEITQRRKSVSFVHKSHQEFFAAIYLSQTAEDADLKQILEGFSDLARAMEIEKVFTFVSGMNPSVSCEIAKAIMQHVNLDPRVQQYRESCADEGAPNEDLVKRIQGVILAGIEEGENNDVKPPPLQLQDIWMENDDRDFPPSRIFACKTALDLSHVKSVSIDKPGDISRDEIWRLFKASLPNLQKLVLLGCHISVRRVKKVVRRNGGDLQALGLYYDDRGIVDFSRLSQEDLQQILAAPNKSLGLVSVRLTHAQMGFLSRHLSTRSFTELFLGSLYCTEHGRRGECLSLDLPASRDINRLELESLPLQNVAFHPERLVRCRIMDLPETVAVDVTRCLRGAEQLEVLQCGGYAASALVELGRTLPSLTNLRDIGLYNVDLRGHEQLLVSDQKQLELIGLGSVTLTADHLRRLLASLPTPRVGVYLGDSENTVTITEDTTDFIKELRDSPDIGVTKEGDVKREGDTCTVQDFVFYTKN